MTHVAPSVVTTDSGPQPKPALAGYDLIRPIGRGGMGVVWEAIEHRFDRRVAVKVHLKGLAPEEKEQNDLWTEALVAARIGDPSIVRVLDVGYTLDEHPFYTMEIVDGTDLGALIADGPLAPRRAIAIAADIARAAGAAHEHGVIHRDLKPRNIIVDATGRARVLDFGIALNVSGTDKYEGQFVGSLGYMAPEQIIGGRIVPQTDIFAIGVMLYIMLTGQRPFLAKTTPELLAAIATVDPIVPSKVNSGIHEDLDFIVMRCLAKAPEERFPSAKALFEMLSAIAEGRALDTRPPSVRRIPLSKKSAPPPDERPKRDDAKKHMSWSWKLASSPEALWPYVANTERFNRAVGLAPVSFKDEPNPDGGALRTGEQRVMGMQLKWREYPFQWVKGREHSVFRWYSTGPVSAVWNQVTMVPLEGGGTELKHDIWMTPRGMIGSFAAFLEGSKLGPSIDRFYRRLDEIVSGGNLVDPFEPAHAASPEARLMVDEICKHLYAEGFKPEIVEKLAMHLLSAPDGVLRTLRPYELADAWGMDRAELLDVMIHAAHDGLLEAAWDVVCPKCMLAHESLKELQQVTRMGTCKACASSFQRDLRESVELVFVPSPKLRQVDQLTFCAGSPALRPHVLAQQVLDPGEIRSITLQLPRGTYRIAGVIAKTPAEIVASAVGFETRAEVVATEERMELRPAIVRAGEVTLVLRNDTDVEETIRVEVPGARLDGVSASTAMTHPTFSELFTKQLPAHGEHLPVSQLAFVYVAFNGRGELFERLGDVEACAELSRLDDIVREHAQLYEGNIVPSALDLLIVGFPSAVRAMQAALGIHAQIGAAPFRAPIVMAAHSGRCIALGRNGKAEFFGETVHRGQALLGDCPPGGIALSAAFAADRAVAVAVHESGLKMGVEQSTTGPYAGRRVTVLR